MKPIPMPIYEVYCIDCHQRYLQYYHYPICCGACGSVYVIVRE